MAKSVIRKLLWNRKVPLLWCILIPLLGTIGLFWLIIWFLTSNHITVIGKTVIEGQGEFLLGQNNDVDFGNKLWVKLGNSEWQSVGWSMNGAGDSISATSPNRRFHAIVAEGSWNISQFAQQDIPIIVIFDSQTRLIWPTVGGEVKPRHFWMDAWKQIKDTNPRFPKPPA